MSDLIARFKVDLSQVRGAFGEVGRLSSRIAVGGQFASATREIQRTNQALAQSPGFVSRFSAAMGRTGRVAAGIAGVTIALVALNRRFPVIGEVARKAFDAIMKGSAGAVTASSRAAAAMSSLKVAATAAAGIYALARAFRVLRSESSNLPQPKLPGAGAAGGGVGGAFRGSFLGNLASDAVQGGFRAVAGNLRSGLQASADLEQIEISYEVMAGLGPAKKALGEIRTLAEATPFSLPGLADAGKTLLAFGLAAEDLPRQLRMLGDVAGGNQQKLGQAALVFGQISSAGRLMGQDLLQLVNLGFNPLQTIAERTGESMVDLKKRMEQGAVSFEEVEAAFVAATSEGGRFFQMTERQSGTFAGVMAKLEDAVTAARIAFATPIMNALKPAIAGLTEFYERMRDGAAGFGERIAQGIDFVRAALQTMGGGGLLMGVGKALQYGVQVAVDTLFKGISAAVALLQDTSFMGEIGRALEIAALRFREVMLGVAATLVEEIGAVLPKGMIHEAKHRNAVDYLRASGDVAAAEREALEADGGGLSVADFVERLRGEFEDARGLFGSARNDALLQEITNLFGEARELAKRFGEERRNKGGEEAPSAPKREGLIPVGGGGGSVAGAFQRAVNLIQGRTVNELVAAEAQKTNDLLKGLAATAKETRDAAQNTARNTGKGRRLTVNVVPTFGDNMA